MGHVSGKLVGSSILGLSLLGGIALYYLQVYHFYEPVEDGRVELVSLATGQSEEVLYEDLRVIDANSSPIRYRACFSTSMSQAMLSETYETYPDAEPLVAPDWFDCFDANAIAEMLQSGAALAFLGQRNVQYGIDRVVVVSETGDGFVWHQINECGAVVFDGHAAPEGCPEP